MNISFAIESNFKDSVQELKSIKASIENYLTCLQEEIASIRRLQLSLVANPQVKLYNELVKLYYLTQIHLDNSQSYKSTLDEQFLIDKSLVPRIESLVEDFNELEIKYALLEKGFSSYSSSDNSNACTKAYQS